MRNESEESVFIKHVGCEACGSSDANSLYSDGNTHCFSCGTTVFSEAEGSVRVSKPSGLLTGSCRALNTRRISENTCKKYAYSVTEQNGLTVQVANYHSNKDKKLVGQKIRTADKGFSYRGQAKNLSLFGQNLFAAGGRKVIITEGELDALSVAEAFSCKWPVVSLINGAGSALKNIKENLEWVLSFKEVVLWFDDDDAGRSAVQEVAGLFKPGQLAEVSSTGFKDASELLVAKGPSAVVSASYNSGPVRIDGVVNGSELWELLSTEEVFETYTYPFPMLQEKFKGIRKGELVTFTAGSGVGKSTIVKEIAYHLLMKERLKIGYVALEENIKRSALGFMGMYLNKPLFFEYDKVSMEDKKEAWQETMGDGRLFFYDHFGSLDEANLLTKLRLLITQQSVDFIILDHVSIVVSGNADVDERKAIDALMTNLRSLAEETQAGILVISHLRRPQGDKGHEDGAAVSLSQLRGSGAIAQLSDAVIGVERNMRDEENSNRVKLRVLKNRFVGEVGLADTLEFDKVTGRMSQVTDVFEGEF